MRLETDQRKLVAGKIMDWGNLVFVGLVISQLIPGTDPFSFTIANIGILVAVLAYVVAYALMKGGAR